MARRRLPSDMTPLADRLRTPPEVPTTSVYSKTDGVVHWRACHQVPGKQAESIVVRGSHCGLVLNALALHAIADRLAQDEGAWQPFEPRGWRAALYRQA